MSEHYILCVLSNLREDAKKRSYSSQSLKKDFSGLQTNEAPVKSLIWQAEKVDKKPITGIICLTTKECRVAVPISVLAEEISAKDYFERSIEEFYRDELSKGNSNPAANEGFFKTIRYDTTDPAACLSDVIALLDNEDTLVDIDTTGGPRDAAFLLTTIAQFIETKYEVTDRRSNTTLHTELGRTAYSNLDGKTITSQNDTFELNDLIYAISSYTSYGRADMLVDYFNKHIDARGDLAGLPEALKAFSDDLSLCRTKDINQNINKIHDALDSFDIKLKTKVSEETNLRYLVDMIENAPSDADIESIKEEISEKLNLTKSEGQAINSDSRWAKLAAYAAPSDFDKLSQCKTLEELESFLGDQLTRIKNDPEKKLPTSERLFGILIDNLRNGIPARAMRSEPKQLAEQTIGIMRWCVDRGMIQQALALYKERVPECLEQLGLISWGTEPVSNPGTDDANKEMVNRINQLAMYPRYSKDIPECLNRENIDSLYSFIVNRHGYLGKHTFNLKIALCAAFPEDAVNGVRLSNLDNHGERLSAVLVWYCFLTYIRNDIMHVNESDNYKLRWYKKACNAVFANTQFIKCDYPDDDSPTSLRTALTLALDALEGKYALRCKPEIQITRDNWKRDQEEKSQRSASN